jgi:hypothetical protein
MSNIRTGVIRLTAGLTAAALSGAVVAGIAGHNSGRGRATADDCFTVTITGTPLQPAPGATICSPIPVP